MAAGRGGGVRWAVVRVALAIDDGNTKLEGSMELSVPTKGAPWLEIQGLSLCPSYCHFAFAKAKWVEFS